MKVVGTPLFRESMICPPCWMTKSRDGSPGGAVRKTGELKWYPVVGTGVSSRSSGVLAAAPPLPANGTSMASPATRARSPPRVPHIVQRIRALGGRRKVDRPSPDRAGDELLEARHELLALAEQVSLRHHSRAYTSLDALDQNAVLRPDLAVEREQLLDPGGVGVGREEVVEEAGRALGAGGQDRADREVRRARVGVELQVRPDEVELPLPLSSRWREL